MKVGYGKIGRSILLDPAKWGPVGGDNEPLYLLRSLAERHPNVEWVILGRHADADTAELPPNVIAPPMLKMPKKTREPKPGKKVMRVSPEDVVPLREHQIALTRDLDGIILWAGQHGTSNWTIPMIDDRSVMTDPQDSFMFYAGPVIAALNAWRDADPQREEVWLCSDVRNYLKGRDQKWPIRESVIAQYEQTREQKFERYDSFIDPGELGFPGRMENGVWVGQTRYTYDRLEIVGIPNEWMPVIPWQDRDRFNIVINENRSYVATSRDVITRDWVIPLQPTKIAGKWSDKGMEIVGQHIEPIPHHQLPELLGAAKTSFTSPASGSGWATTKWWECAALGAVCFCHPKWDSQGHVIPTLDQVREGKVDHDPVLKSLAGWLRVETPEQLADRVHRIDQDESLWKALAQAQWLRYCAARQDQAAVREIERRLGLAHAA